MNKVISALKGQPIVDPKFSPEEEEDEANALKKAIDEHLKQFIVSKFKQKKGFTPSENSECGRFWFYMFNGVTIHPTHNSRTQRIFDGGNDIHDRIKKYFKDMGILISEEFEIRFPQHLPVPVGPAYVDAIIEWDGPKVVEIKSISEAGYMGVRLKKKPKPEHYKQVQMYLDALEMDEGFVLYLNKNTSDILILPVTRDREFLDKLYKKYEKFYSAYKKGEKPKRPYKSITSEHCKYCPVKEMCWAEAD